MTTVDEAIANAVRILQHAEEETNLSIVDSLTPLANAWIDLAWLLLERQV